MSVITENVLAIGERIDAAARKTGRTAQDITLVAVTKGIAGASVLEAQHAGLKVFAENRVQEAETKVPAVQAEWHMVGHLQSNKIKPAIELFSLIQSVDSVRLAEKIQTEARTLQKTVSILLEVNISGEEQKFGFSPEAVYAALETMKSFSHVRVLGLMGIAPNTKDLETRRASFKKLKGLFGACRSVKSENFDFKLLSMGMSEDFEIAIEEGSNMLRLGRVIFGERKK